MLSAILRRSFDSDDEYLAYVRERLFEPLGMTSAFVEADFAGNLVFSSLGYATARDWARFGLFMAQDGVFGGKRLLSEKVCLSAVACMRLNGTIESGGVHLLRWAKRPPTLPLVADWLWSAGNLQEGGGVLRGWVHFLRWTVQPLILPPRCRPFGVSSG